MSAVLTAQVNSAGHEREGRVKSEEKGEGREGSRDDKDKIGK